MPSPMIRIWSPLWISLILLQSSFQSGQSKRIRHVESDELSIDQAYLNFTNVNISTVISLNYNWVPCEHCDYSLMFSHLEKNTSNRQIIPSQFPYDFQIFADDDVQNPLCSILNHQFSEHGTYILEVSQNSENKTNCVIIDLGTSSYYYTPIIIGTLLLCSFVISLQLWNRCKNSNRYKQILHLIGHGETNIQDSNIGDMDTAREITASRREHDALGHEPNFLETGIRAALVTRNTSNKATKTQKKRLHSLDTFRGLALMIMIFVNYGGGGYWFFDHSVWNGLTLADLVFPWFVWMMGASIVLSQKSLRAKKISKSSIFIKILRRTCILFLLGLILQGGEDVPERVRILGVLQRLALCYFITAVIALAFSEPDTQLLSNSYASTDDNEPTLLRELYRCIFRFWIQWLCVLLIVLAWLLITFIPSFENCPSGYLGPGGKHEHGNYTNCTGGMAGYIDRIILGPSHLYDSPTCKSVYLTGIPYDPEGIMGNLTGTLLCYLGVQAGNIFSNGTKTSRICGQWITFGIICGSIGLILSKGGHSESWIPINKNLWSLSFVLVLAGLAFIILTLFYILVDIKKWFNGEPWIWLGMNSIVIYVGHEICSDKFPVQFDLGNTHVKRLAVNAYGVTIWMIIAGIMYYKKCFIAI